MRQQRPQGRDNQSTQRPGENRECRWVKRLGPFAEDASLEKALAHKIEKLEVRLKRYHPEVAQLELHLEHGDAEQIRCKIHLRIYRDSLHAHKESLEARVALDRSFEALFRELDTYRQKLSKPR